MFCVKRFIKVSDNGKQAVGLDITLLSSSAIIGELLLFMDCVMWMLDVQHENIVTDTVLEKTIQTVFSYVC